mgnify:CR=1 FL=1
MSKFIVTAVAGLSMLFVGIQSLSYRSNAISDLNLSGRNAQAANMTDAVVGDGAAVLGNALPRLFILLILVLLVAMLALTR